MYSPKMGIEYSLPRISVISSYIIANKTVILSLFCKRLSSYFPAKKRTWSNKNEINAIVSQTWKFWILQ